MRKRKGRPKTASAALRANGYRDGTGKYQVSNLKPWHTRVVDYMLLVPHAKQVDIAKHFGVTPQWVGQLLQTDAFKEYYAERVRSHDEVVSKMTVGKLQSLAMTSIDKMAEKVRSSDVSFGQAREAADLALKALNYTGDVNINTGNGSTVQVAVGSDVLSRARQRLATHMQNNDKTIEHDEGVYLQVTQSMSAQAQDLGKIESDNSE